jgi:hypothetical protein
MNARIVQPPQHWISFAVADATSVRFLVNKPANNQQAQTPNLQVLHLKLLWVSLTFTNLQYCSSARKRFSLFVAISGTACGETWSHISVALCKCHCNAVQSGGVNPRGPKEKGPFAANRAMLGPAIIMSRRLAKLLMHSGRFA